jgi:hypothetical protein
MLPMQLNAAALRVPLSGVQEMCRLHGSPLPLDQQLCRPVQPESIYAVYFLRYDHATLRCYRIDSSVLIPTVRRRPSALNIRMHICCLLRALSSMAQLSIHSNRVL